MSTHHGAVPFKSWRMIGREGCRRATVRNPRRRNVEAVPVNTFDVLPGCFQLVSHPGVSSNYGLQPIVTAKSWVARSHRPWAHGFCVRERSFRVFRQQLLHHPSLRFDLRRSCRASVSVEGDNWIRVPQQLLNEPNVTSVRHESAC